VPIMCSEKKGSRLGLGGESSSAKKEIAAPVWGGANLHNSQKGNGGQNRQNIGKGRKDSSIGGENSSARRWKRDPQLSQLPPAHAREKQPEQRYRQWTVRHALDLQEECKRARRGSSAVGLET